MLVLRLASCPFAQQSGHTLPRFAAWREDSKMVSRHATSTTTGLRVRNALGGNHSSMRPKGVSQTLDVPFAHVWRLRDGKCVSMRNYIDVAELYERQELRRAA